VQIITEPASLYKEKQGFASRTSKPALLLHRLVVPLEVLLLL